MRLYSFTHMATVGIKGLIMQLWQCMASIMQYAVTKASMLPLPEDDENLSL